MSAFLIPALSAEQALLLAPDQIDLPCVPNSPFHNLLGLSRTEMAASRGLEAPERRLLTEHFVSTFQWSTVYPLLPLRLVVPSDVPPWQPRHCRSYYRWLPPEETLTAEDCKGWMTLTWCCVCSTLAPGVPSSPNAFAANGTAPFRPGHHRPGCPSGSLERLGLADLAHRTALF